LLADNSIQMEMIDEAVSRVLHAKLRLDLFNAPYADRDQPEIDLEAHRQIAKELAQQSIVLLKNEADVLPLKRDKVKKIVIVGPYADSPHDQLGTWVMDGKREWSVTPLAALTESLGDQVELTYVACSQVRYGEPAQVVDQELQAALTAAQSADMVLLFVGEDEAWSGEAHSRVDLSLPGRQGELVRALAGLEVPVVLTVMAGRPLAIGAEVEAVDAVLYAWQGGTMAGPALAELLLGEACPSGKLPVTFPKSVGQIPIYYNHPNTGRPSPADYQPPALKDVVGLHNDVRYTSHYIDSDPFPLFLFGFGLTYTNFAYYDLEIESSTITPGQDLRLRVRVGNGGKREAVETVQLYTRDKVASVVRPVQELKAFRRVRLRPGESKIVEFALPYEDLGFFNEQEQYLIEPGEFEVAIGGSSNTRLSAKFLVE
jgi:beta-glucosidase